MTNLHNMTNPQCRQTPISSHEMGWSGRCVGCVYSSAVMLLRKMAFLLLFSADANAFAQDRVAAAVDGLPQVKKIDQVAISPDGSRVAYIVDGELSIAPISGADTWRIAQEQKLAARDVAWSADSQKVTWLADLPGDVPASQLWEAASDRSQ